MCTCTKHTDWWLLSMKSAVPPIKKFRSKPAVTVCCCTYLLEFFWSFDSQVLVKHTWKRKEREGEMKTQREYVRELDLFLLFVPVSVHSSAPECNYTFCPPGSLHTQTHCRVAAQWTVLVPKQKVNLCWWKQNRRAHEHTFCLIRQHCMLINLPLSSTSSSITLVELNNTS